MAQSSGYEYACPAIDMYTHDCISGDEDEETVLNWCMDVGLVPGHKLCPKCKHEMRLASNLHMWRCNRKECRCALSVRPDTIFYHSKLPLSKLVRMVFYFASTTPTKMSESFAA